MNRMQWGLANPFISLAIIFQEDLVLIVFNFQDTMDEWEGPCVIPMRFIILDSLVHETVNIRLDILMWNWFSKPQASVSYKYGSKTIIVLSIFATNQTRFIFVLQCLVLQNSPQYKDLSLLHAYRKCSV
jgi:hypothetical protein